MQDFFLRRPVANTLLHSACSCQINPHSKQGTLTLSGEGWLPGNHLLAFWSSQAESGLAQAGSAFRNWPPCTGAELRVPTEGAVWDVCAVQQE